MSFVRSFKTSGAERRQSARQASRKLLWQVMTSSREPARCRADSMRAS